MPLGGRSLRRREGKTLREATDRCGGLRVSPWNPYVNNACNMTFSGMVCDNQLPRLAGGEKWR
jgi:hypothetical protein